MAPGMAMAGMAGMASMAGGFFPGFNPDSQHSRKRRSAEVRDLDESSDDTDEDEEKTSKKKRY